MDARAVMTQDLLDIFESLEQAGVVDDHLKMVYSLKDVNGPFYFADLLMQYCSDARQTIKQIAETLDEAVVNFKELDELCLKLKGGSECIGACRLGTACADFRGAIDDKSKNMCISQFKIVKKEFYSLQEHFDAIIELERKIVSH